MLSVRGGTRKKLLTNVAVELVALLDRLGAGLITLLDPAFVRAIFYGRIKYEDEQAMCGNPAMENCQVWID